MNSNPLKLLSRLFRKNPDNAVISELYSKMSQPLFVHPELGEAVMRSYLDAVTIPNMLSGDSDGYGSFVTKHNNIAVLDISGALTAREESVPCAAPPASYEVIKQDMAELLADESITTIIGRFDSPGGMASQNMDLSDFIYSSRGQGTKMIAMVDDMAYSAAFGIASAFDEIWVTRTSGVGSVGVVSYHVDQSEANKRAGIKVEYIYAGDKKILGNPHESLSKEGRAEFQNEVDRLFNIFTSTVARNLGLPVEQVKDTQAGTFHGEEAITAKFAHKLGTFDELLLSLMSEEVAEQTVVVAKPTNQELIDTAVAKAIAQANGMVVTEQKTLDGTVVMQKVDSKQLEENKKFVAEIIGSNELDQAVEELAAEQNSEDNVEDNVVDEQLKDEAGLTAQDRADLENELEEKELDVQQELESGIRALCTAADQESQVDEFINLKMSLDQVRYVLLSLTSTSETIVNSKSVALSGDKAESISESWDTAFEKV